MRWVHFADTTPRALKEHRCFLCTREIAKGETYRKRTGAGDGDIVVMKCHTDCLDYADDTFDITDWECFSPGDSEFICGVQEWKENKVTK